MPDIRVFDAYGKACLHVREPDLRLSTACRPFAFCPTMFWAVVDDKSPRTGTKGYKHQIPDQQGDSAMVCAAAQCFLILFRIPASHVLCDTTCCAMQCIRSICYVIFPKHGSWQALCVHPEWIAASLKMPALRNLASKGPGWGGPCNSFPWSSPKHVFPPRPQPLHSKIFTSCISIRFTGMLLVITLLTAGPRHATSLALVVPYPILFTFSCRPLELVGLSLIVLLLY